MAQLTDQGRELVNALARQYGVSTDAVETMLHAVARGGGTMAQFSHPEFGGSGQWMMGGMTMVGDMFNHGLKNTVDNLCAALSNGLANGPMTVAEPGDIDYVWWPQELGQPSIVGGQNDLRYAVFPMAGRVAVQRGGTIELYDLGQHQIGGVSQQQDGGGTRFTFSSQFGQFDVTSLNRVDGGAPQQTQAPSAPTDPMPMPSEEPAPQPDVAAPAATPQNESETEDALAKLERLAALLERGLLTREEFDAKKADLLSRI